MVVQLIKGMGTGLLT